jgi:hypothetical protein
VSLDKTTQKQKGGFIKGRSGNPNGRPKGSLNKATILAQELIDNEGELIVRKALELAKSGDGAALRIVMDRLIPPRRDRHVTIKLPEISNATDAASAMAAVINEVASGSITAAEAEGLTKLIGDYSKILEVSQIEERLKRLEEAAG